MATALTAHPARTIVASILDLKGAPAFAEEPFLSNTPYASMRDKVFLVAETIAALFDQSPAELTSAPGLSQLQASLQQILAELNAFISNKNAGHIANASNYVEQQVLSLLWAFGPKVDSLSPQTLARVFQQQAEFSRQTIAEVSAQRDALGATLTELKIAAEAQQAKFDALSERVAQERAEAAAAVAKLDQQFAQNESARLTVFEASVEKMRGDFGVVENGAKASSSALVKSLEDKQVEAARIVQVVGNIGVTGNYQQIATSEAKDANFWRWVTVGIFGVAIAIAFGTFYKFWHEPITLENTWSIAVRLLYALAITGPALYTARESARHRSNSDRAKQTELELASIGPFIELMPEVKKVEIREKLIASYFGKGVDAHTVTSPVDVASIKDLIVEVLKTKNKA